MDKLVAKKIFTRTGNLYFKMNQKKDHYNFSLIDIYITIVSS